MPATSTPKPARLRLLLALLLGAIHGWLALSVSDRHSAVFDEPPHLVSGLAYWTEADFRFQPENGLLPQRWFGLSLLLAPDVQPPEPRGTAWDRADVWALGEDLLHGGESSSGSILRRARFMNALAGACLVACITLWSGSIFGSAGALGAGVLAAFSPTLLAHSGFATSDTMGALGFLAATLAYWRMLHRVTVARVLAAGSAAAFFALSKYSAAIFPFVACALLLLRLRHPAPLPWRGGRRRGWQRLGPLALGSAAAATLAWGLIWGAYGFRYEARGPNAGAAADFIKTWDQVLLPQPIFVEMAMADGLVLPGHSRELRAGPVQHAVRFARDHRLLPEAWLYGFAFVDRHSRFRLAYFCGTWSATGWRSFFPVAYLVKSTPAELALHAFGLAFAGGLALRRKRRFHRSLPVLVPMLIYGAFTLASDLNIGHRHLLPIYGFGAVLTALAISAAQDFAKAGARRLMLVGLSALVATQVLSSFAIRPSYLAYFNCFAGGPDEGYRYLADSSLDWGQDLPALRDWLASSPPGSPLHLAYFGNGSPREQGLTAVRMADDAFDADPRRPLTTLWEPGRYAISATMWNRVYTKVRGPWSESYEARYQALRAWLARSAREGIFPPASGPDGEPLEKRQLQRHFLHYDHLRFGRLLHQLSLRRPDARVAHNWFVFDLSDEELRVALEGPLLTPAVATAPAPATTAAPPPTPDKR